MKLTLGKWQYDLTIGGLKVDKYNIYAASWVKVLK